MTRVEHLKFCKICKNKSFDLNKGIVCNLTDEIADFEDDCLNFIGNREEIHKSNEIDTSEKGSKIANFFSLFIPKEGYFVTPIIVDICLFIFLIMSLSGVNIFLPDSESLIKWGANFKALSLDGQYWRLFTNFFIHIGIIHVFFNMYALIYIGLLLEPFIGRKHILISYLVTGVAASVASLWWHDLVISAGASGAIFGLYGVYIALITTNLLDKETKNKILKSMLFFVGYNLLYGLKGGIDNAAHIGGLISGLIIGYSLYPSLVKSEIRNKSIFINYSAIASILIFAFFIVSTSSNSIGEFDKIMNEFAEVEQEAMSLFYLPKYTNDEEYLNTINKEGIPNWKKCRELIVKMEAIEELPYELYERTLLLKKYCDFRIKSFELMAQSIESNSEMYSFLINSYNQKIQLIIQKLQGEEVDDDLLEEPEFPEFPNNIRSEVLYIVNGKPVDSIEDIEPEA